MAPAQPTSFAAPDTREPLLVLGTRLLAREMVDLIADMPGWRLDGFVENQERERCAQPIAGLPVHWVDGIGLFAASHRVICGISTPQRARYVDQALALGMRFATLVHPTAHVARSTELGEGVFISTGAIISSYVKLGRYTFVNRGALIGHDTVIGECVSIQPGANIGGDCRIADGAYVAIGAVIMPHLKIGRGAIVGAGAVVTHDVPDDVQVLGVPARVTRRGVAGRV